MSGTVATDVPRFATSGRRTLDRVNADSVLSAKPLIVAAFTSRRQLGFLLLLLGLSNLRFQSLYKIDGCLVSSL